MYQQYI